MGYVHIDDARIPGLARELAGDANACLRFLDDFLVAWPARLERVRRGVGSPAIDDPLTALLTLSTSSAMVGAGALSAAARDLYARTQSLGTVPAEDAARFAALGMASMTELRHAADGWRATASAA